MFKSIDQWRQIAQGNVSTVKEILELKNIEQRIAAMKLMGIEKLMEQGGGILLDTCETGNALYVFLDLFSQPAFYLKYKDPSTDRVYVSGISPDVFSGITFKSLSKKELQFTFGRWSNNSELTEDDVKAAVTDGLFIGYADKAMSWKFGLTLDQYLHDIVAQA